MVKFFASCNLSSLTVDKSEFQDFVKELNPRISLPGRITLGRSVIPNVVSLRDYLHTQVVMI